MSKRTLLAIVALTIICSLFAPIASAQEVNPPAPSRMPMPTSFNAITCAQILSPADLSMIRGWVYDPNIGWFTSSGLVNDEIATDNGHCSSQITGAQINAQIWVSQPVVATWLEIYIQTWGTDHQPETFISWIVNGHQLEGGGWHWFNLPMTTDQVQAIAGRNFTFGAATRGTNGYSWGSLHLSVSSQLPRWTFIPINLNRAR
ncbi:hypothetical protein KC614_05030 [candidate division WWE3 bacterium]|uniref:Uncharacterized protein n=1 Tax=candidate division WWE3 bacterium TaxID=2053526 RepID=A0A955LL73_UNCKA|nr:hypothetical protein [candidate division WWE3 bacterium]